MRILEKLVGPLTIEKLLRAYRSANNLSVTQLERKIRLKRKKKFTLKEVLKVAKALDEDEDFYALVWFQEQARSAGLEAEKFLRDLK